MFKNKKILIVGASSDFSKNLNKILYEEKATIGLHYNKNNQSISPFYESDKIKKIQKNLNSIDACYSLIDEFVKWAGGIDILVQLSGDLSRPIHWENIIEKDWEHDLSINLTTPFFLVQRAVKYMKSSGGKILLTSTASASYGGGTTSLAYGIAKGGVECIIKRIAKDCAKYNIIINGIAPGFILTKFHTERKKLTKKQIKERIKLIPLKRSGTIEEITETILFLISEKSSYITGEIITINGGDRL